MGCGGKSTPVSSGPKETKDDGEEVEETKKPLEAKGWATLKGKVTLDGEIPPRTMLKGIKEKEECHGGKEEENIDQTWLVNDDKGVENVAIWIKPPKGKFFKIKDEDKKNADEVVLRQPHCAFIPHVLTLYPSYFDGTKQQPSGQKLVVKNDTAKITHNTKIVGGSKNGTWDSGAMPPGKEATVDRRKPEDRPLAVGCNIHPWMNAKIWVFDHPYSTVTKKDGTYEIKNIPAGAKVYVVAWHEAGECFTDDGSAVQGQEITLKDGETKTVNFKVKRK
jgi:hypothetical protein